MTTDAGPRPLERLDGDAADLMGAHPPRIQHPNKRVVLDIACPPGAAIGGRVAYSRWPELPPPAHLAPPAAGRVVAVPGWYAYASDPGLDGALAWHVNFADAELFGYYAGRHFAQDEAQVAEHPVLASVREALLARGLPARTEEDGRATPVLVRGAERRVVVATDPDRAAGVEGLYGQRFGKASPEVVARATRVLEPPTISNVLAIAAPAYGSGPYRRGQVRAILATAYSGFRAARTETREQAGASAVVIHTGYWGGGAFGGNRELLTLLQLVAAEAAEIDRLVFHTGPAGGEAPYLAALASLAELVPPHGIDADALLDRIVERGYAWGKGTGD